MIVRVFESVFLYQYFCVSAFYWLILSTTLQCSLPFLDEWHDQLTWLDTVCFGFCFICEPGFTPVVICWPCVWRDDVMILDFRYELLLFFPVKSVRIWILIDVDDHVNALGDAYWAYLAYLGSSYCFVKIALVGTFLFGYIERLVLFIYQDKITNYPISVLSALVY